MLYNISLEINEDDKSENVGSGIKTYKNLGD